MENLSITVISDLHCHPTEDGIDDTYLKTDLLRTPSAEHPVESVVQLIKENNITSDLTLCPGDFTNKSNKQGFISGWEFSLEIHKALNGKEIIATLGNHDIDSFGVISDYCFEVARGIKKGFPIKDENLLDTFWSKGSVFIEGENYRVLAINSSHFHYTKSTSEYGKVGDETLEYIESYLSKIEDSKITIALSHHHPVDHSRLKLGEKDKIVNGNELLEIIGKYKFDLFIHGHKHDPLLRYHTCYSNNHKIPILSAGSFSATSNITFSGQRNTFHKIDIIKDNGIVKGTIQTWTFLPRSGWKVRYDDEGFHSHTGFGFSGKVEELALKIINEVGSSHLMKWIDIIQKFPEVKYLIPTEAIEFSKIINEKGLRLDEKIWQNPEVISNTNLI
ncbi:metallophosphoesterase family protein [Aureibaculum conchae]|uniref:metallophosphoesterase family protein n=1 Tax=Aureibaculum sp. 2308TA14-22 TaxID=3108392 RepID=UPI003393044A